MDGRTVKDEVRLGMARCCYSKMKDESANIKIMQISQEG